MPTVTHPSTGNPRNPAGRLRNKSTFSWWVPGAGIVAESCSRPCIDRGMCERGGVCHDRDCAVGRKDTLCSNEAPRHRTRGQRRASSCPEVPSPLAELGLAFVSQSIFVAAPAGSFVPSEAQSTLILVFWLAEVEEAASPSTGPASIASTHSEARPLVQLSKGYAETAQKGL